MKWNDRKRKRTRMKRGKGEMKGMCCGAEVEEGWRGES